MQKEFSHNIGNHFIAITDPGSPLEQTALSRNFRKIFLADPDVGGRYSVLTTFGLVPAGLLGINLDDLLNKAAEMSAQCRILDPIGRNPGLVLGAIMGQAAISGRDKVSLLTDPEIRPFGNWLEQLIAESSGKSGLGILPIVEDFSLPAKYSGNDRLTVYLRLNGSFDKQIKRLLRAKQPVIVFEINHKENLFQEFYKWEFAVAVACSVLRVNAFNQPDVQDNKNRTKNKIDDFKDKGKLIEPTVVWEDENVKVYAPETYKFSELKSIRDLVVAFIASGQKGDYIALNAYLPSEKQNVNALNKLRKCIQIKTSFATTRGFGPRFLHSTGQIHKGGASNGLFIQFTGDPIKDLKYGDLNFGILERAQALGDYESLTARGRRIIRIHIKKGSLARLVNDII
jgi:transaldolase/glucose-6-phosphate isomerase